MQRAITLQGSYRFPVPIGSSFTASVAGAFNGSTVTFQYLYDAIGTAQVETATVTAASGATSDGTSTLSVTVPIYGTFDVPVALVAATHTTATLVADAYAAALNADGRVSGKWIFAGSGANVTMTRRKDSDGYYAANEDVNIAIPAGLGITAAATSVGTTPGVGPVPTAAPFATTALSLTAAGEKSGVNMGSRNEIVVAVTVANPTGIVVNVNPSVTRSI